MASRILGGLVALWGAVALLHRDSYAEGNDTFGNILTLIIGGLLLSVGMYFLLRRSKSNQQS